MVVTARQGVEGSPRGKKKKASSSAGAGLQTPAQRKPHTSPPGSRCPPQIQAPLVPKYDSKYYHRELSKVLAPNYVAFAFSLPPGCGTIWSILVDDMYSRGSGSEAFAQDGAKFLAFLQPFFSQQLIDIIEENLTALSHSYLGINFALRRAMASIGKSIVDGIREHAVEEDTPLAHFLGQFEFEIHEEEKVGQHIHEEEQVSQKDWQMVTRRRAKGANVTLAGSSAGGRVEEEQAGQKDWQIVTRRRSKGAKVTLSAGGRADGGDSSAGGGGAEGDGFADGGGSSAGGGAEGDGSGNAGQGSGGGGPEGEADGPTHFSSMKDNTFKVQLPAFDTPPRSTLGRGLKLKDRSGLFAQRVGGRIRRLYDPQNEQPPGFVSLFHGTRTSSLVSFAFEGIVPKVEGSEFSKMPAFYACNSIRHAYEWPLHYKPGRCVGDCISVLEFKVDVEILHGQKPPAGDTRAFEIRWFSKPSQEWKEFCIGNMAQDPKLRAKTPIHSYDIVIGPICKPLDGASDMAVISDQIGRGNVYVAQVAFCSSRSWRWLESCFTRVFEECREPKSACEGSIDKDPA